MSASTPPSRPSARDWLGGIRLSGFTMIMLGLVLLGALVLLPTVGTYVEQRQRIAGLEEAVQLTREEIAELEAEQERWGDPAYIVTQARERLYFVRPGEVVYLVDNDLDPADLPQDAEPVSDEVEEASSEWAEHLLRSLAAAGLAEHAVGSD